MCDCITKVEEKVKAEMGAETAILLNQSLLPANRIISEVEIKRGRKKSKVVIYSNYCPLCGQKYEN